MHKAEKIFDTGKGFALVEILVAVAILSLVLLGVLSGVASSIHVLNGSKNSTHAMLIAKSKMNEFIDQNMRGSDLKKEPVKEYDGYFFTRETVRFEHPMLGPLPAKITTITVTWTERGSEKSYDLSYIYQAQ